MKFQRKVTNVYNGWESYVDCDARCSECGNLPSYFITWADEDGDNSDEHTLYCTKHNPAFTVSEMEKKEWDDFTNSLDPLTPEQRAENEYLKANLNLMEKGIIC